MNSNEFLSKNWMGAVLLIVVVVFLYLSFGRRDRAEIAENPSFIYDNPGATLSPGYDAGSQIAPAPGIQQPAQPAATAGEPIQWCVLLDRANHIPDLFGEGIDNGGGGTNWHSYANDDPRGPHGVLMDGGKIVFFVKKSYLDRNGANPSTAELKTSALGWRALGMTWENIAGEPALVYVK